MTPITRAAMSSGSRRDNTLTAIVQKARISVHNSMEPSCEPQEAVNRYRVGNCEKEFIATLRTEKSFCRKAVTRQA